MYDFDGDADEDDLRHASAALCMGFWVQSVLLKIQISSALILLTHSSHHLVLLSHRHPLPLPAPSKEIEELGLTDKPHSCGSNTYRCSVGPGARM